MDKYTLLGAHVTYLDVRIHAHVAQVVEHLHGKQKVSGSIPLVGSRTSKAPAISAVERWRTIGSANRNNIEIRM